MKHGLNSGHGQTGRGFGEVRKVTMYLDARDSATNLCNSTLEMTSGSAVAWPSLEISAVPVCFFCAAGTVKLHNHTRARSQLLHILDDFAEGTSEMSIFSVILLHSLLALKPELLFCQFPCIRYDQCPCAESSLNFVNPEEPTGCCHRDELNRIRFASRLHAGISCCSTKKGRCFPLDACF